MQTNFIKSILVILFSSITYANTCPAWLPLAMEDGLVTIIPIYDESITQPDLDCDGIIDTVDRDLDGDGVVNTLDLFPLDPSESKDSDGDGVGDNADVFPLDASETHDSDRDGVGDNTDRPTAFAQSYIVALNSQDNTITLTGEDDTEALTFRVLTHPSHGTLSGTAPNLHYAPEAGYHGSDSFTFEVDDGSLTSTSATIAIGVIEDITSFIVKKDSPNDHNIGQVDTNGSASGIVLSPDEKTAYIADGDGGLKIINISDPLHPQIIGVYDTDGYAESVVLSHDGTIIYLADYDHGLHIINVSTPTVPTLLTSMPTPSYAKNIKLSADGQTAYIADGDSGLQIIDVSNPSTPTIIGALNTYGWAEGVALSPDEKTAYIASGNGGLYIIDITTPTTPQLIKGFYRTSKGWAYGITISADGNTAFLSSGYTGLDIIDITTPTNPALISTISSTAYNATLSVDGNILYIADHEYLKVINISTLASPQQISTYDIQGKGEDVIVSTSTNLAYFVSGKRRYSSSRFSKLTIIDTARNFSQDLLGSYTLYNPHSLTLSSNENTAYIPFENGLTSVDISTPSSPSFITTFPSLSAGYSANDIALSSDESIAYVATANKGLQLYDISSASTPTLLGSYIAEVRTGSRVETADYDEVYYPDLYTATCDMQQVILSKDGTTAYVACGARSVDIWLTDRVSALFILDVSIPTSPQLIGKYEIDDNGFGQALSVSQDEKTVYLGSHSSGIKVIDITNPSNPKLVSSLFVGYVNDMLLSAEKNALFVATKYDGLKIIDISNSTQPNIIGTYDITDIMNKNRIYSLTLSKDRTILYISGTTALDVTDLTHPKLLTHYGYGDPKAISFDGNKLYAITSSAFNIIDITTSTQNLSKNFSSAYISLHIDNTIKNTMTLSIDTDRQDIITLGSYPSEITSAQYHNQEILIPIESIQDATGETLITLTLRHNGQVYQRKVRLYVY